MSRRIGPLSALVCLALIATLLILFLPTNPKAALAAPPSNPSAAAKPATSAPAAEVTGKAAAPQGTALHVVERGQSLRTLVHIYLPQTSYMTGSELEAGLRQANGGRQGFNLKPGETIIIPGFEGTIHEPSVPVARDYEVRAIYLTGVMAGSAHGLELIQRWRAAGGNAVVFDLKDSDGIVNFPFEHRLNAGAPHPPIRNLPKLARWMHRQGMHVIGRVAIFRDERLVVQHPEVGVQSRRSGQAWRENGKLVWTDPSRPEVQEFNIALARQAAMQGIDEIQFDYVRFPAEGDQKDASFYFESHPLRRPATPDGKVAAAEPTQRSEVIADFLSKAYGELQPRKVLFSLDVFGVMAWQRPIDLAHTGQDITAMAKYCDVLSPMIYPSHFFGMDGYKVPGDAPEHFISESMERFKKVIAGGNVVLRPWLQAFGWKTPSYSPQYVETQVAVAKQNGGIGFLFWNARNDYSKPFAAMPEMRRDRKFFRGDELPGVKMTRQAEKAGAATGAAKT
jgi:hypothetical protein